MTPRRPKKSKRRKGGSISCRHCGNMVPITYTYCDRCLGWLSVNVGRGVLYEELGDRMEAAQAIIDKREGRY